MHFFSRHFVRYVVLKETVRSATSITTLLTVTDAQSNDTTASYCVGTHDLDHSQQIGMRFQRHVPPASEWSSVYNSTGPMCIQTPEIPAYKQQLRRTCILTRKINEKIHDSNTYEQPKKTKKRSHSPTADWLLISILPL